MATIIDVARYITDRLGPMSAMKLQKLAYYCQAWTLVWDEQPLFNDEFEAWANGPVSPTLYAHHRGQFQVDSSNFRYADPGALSPEQRVNIDKIIGFYGQQTAQWLSDLTHQEQPWLQARGNLAPGANSNALISKAAIHEYYSAL
ncbi:MULTISPECIES: Panacea domain-containing protein [Frateuria]|uniref:Uncharacterized phage-associated protein n=1 Tax=Frateuria terrea TaxID=529704 RepID=A0A1H6VTD6_9GAMM|nr:MULTISPECIES: type II toxin-antitoxin system antitoxin SocA domain-containing protein [Frateuria]SEJ03462.1 Uncharacterized phage-associated protein [Frateuria terrea]SFP63914.1 Uncharacterized phage-associated protein [Frateuria terrea]HET6807287.1 type II toxin-antitoxin system antitoxin SocA domain-containing protein [Frateuria sp.]